MKRIISFVLVLIFCLCCVRYTPVSASDNVLNIVKGYAYSSIYYAYDSLNDTQKEICDYLVGLYNVVYLGRRGFNFEQAIQDEQSWLDKVKSFGLRVMAYTNMDFWGSRIDDNFAMYLSSCIQYAMEQNYNSFQAWYSQLPSDFCIPYGEDLLSSWNNFYNDPSGDGISTFGDEVGAWNSGIYYDYAFGPYPWRDAASQQTYNQFIIDNSPVLYSNTSQMPSWFGNGTGQYLFSPTILEHNGDIVDSLFILRSQPNMYQFCRFGFSDMSVMPSYDYQLDRLRYCIVYLRDPGKSDPNTVQQFWARINYNSGILNYGSGNNLGSLIQWAFDVTPFDLANGDGSTTRAYFHGFYPLIEHVYLVDDLNTLSNPQEIYNVTNFGIDPPTVDTIISVPTETIYFYPVFPEYPLPINIEVIIDDHSKDGNGDDPDPDDFEPRIVELTYDAWRPDPNNFDTGMFNTSIDYIGYLWKMTKPLVQYGAAFLHLFVYENDEGETVGPAIAILGIVIIGVAGGIIVKFLL